MISVFLLILKIVLFFILAVLLLCLMIILAVLFVPIRYRLSVHKSDQGEEQLTADFEIKGSVTWLLHLANCHLHFPKKPYVNLRITLFSIFKMPKEEKENAERSKKLKKSTKKTQKDKADQKEQELLKEKAPQKDKILTKEPSNTQKEEKQDPIEDLSVKENLDQSPESEEIPLSQSEEEQKEKKKLFSRIFEIYDKIRETIQKIKSGSQNLIDRLVSIRDHIEFYADLIKSQLFQDAFSLCKTELFKILRMIAPQKIKGKIVVGMEDPSVTGKILAISGLFYPVIENTIQIEGVFDRTVLEIDLFLKGRICLFTIVRAAIKIYFDKNIKKLIKIIKGGVK